MTYQNNRIYPKANRQEQSLLFPEINQPLHKYYSDKAELFLENRQAHQAAKKFKKISSHQLRKVLNQSKVAVREFEKQDADFSKASNLLFALLPMAAYNVGRAKNKEKYLMKELYDFLKTHLNKKTITCKEDIEMFDELFTSIIAYHKYEGGN